MIYLQSVDLSFLIREKVSHYDHSASLQEFFKGCISERYIPVYISDFFVHYKRDYESFISVSVKVSYAQV